MNGRRKDFPKCVYLAEDVCYQIKFKRGLQAKGYMGVCCFDIKEIWISTGLTCQERLETFWHEISHALDFEYGIKLTHKQVYALEKPLSDLFQKNAWVQWAQWKEE